MANIDAFEKWCYFVWHRYCLCGEFWDEYNQGNYGLACCACICCPCGCFAESWNTDQHLNYYQNNKQRKTSVMLQADVTNTMYNSNPVYVIA